MSSDYIPRLRQELLRAGASRQPRRRPARALRPLAAATAVALLVVAVVVAWPAVRDDERAADQTDGSARLSYRVEPPVAEQTAQVLRERLAAAGVEGARVSAPSSARLTITAPATAQADVAALTQQGRFAVYDWERSVIGGAGAITKQQAEARAADVAGGRAVRAENGDGWFALRGEPALTDADIARAEPTVDGATQQPVVAVELTDRGQAALRSLTGELARRGAAKAEPGQSDLDAMQHLAIVIDDRIVGVPFIDFRVAPDGLDGADGLQVSGDLTSESARLLAVILNSGPLPAALSSATGPGSPR